MEQKLILISLVINANERESGFPTSVLQMFVASEEHLQDASRILANPAECLLKCRKLNQSCTFSKLFLLLE